jgi:hypothetical protein
MVIIFSPASANFSFPRSSVTANKLSRHTGMDAGIQAKDGNLSIV